MSPTPELYVFTTFTVEAHTTETAFMAAREHLQTLSIGCSGTDWLANRLEQRVSVTLRLKHIQMEAKLNPRRESSPLTYTFEVLDG